MTVKGIVLSLECLTAQRVISKLGLVAVFRYAVRVLPIEYCNLVSRPISVIEKNELDLTFCYR
jgi:hypothetical protein